jgi:hypothetical protein
MKYISVIIICLICKTSCSQFAWNISPIHLTKATKKYDSTVSKKIVIRYTTNRYGKVIAACYLRNESTSSDQKLIIDAKLRTLETKPIIHTPEGICYNGNYTFCYTAEGKLLLQFQNANNLWLLR